VRHTEFEKVKKVFVFGGQHGWGVLRRRQGLLKVVLRRDGLLLRLRLQLMQ
jgi:hypothetical protein